MFSNIPTIKNLIIKGYKILKFPRNVKWQLEQLMIIYFRNNEDVDRENCEIFLQSQQSSLKKLIFEGFTEILASVYFIMRNLPNLEHLMLSFNDNDIFNDSLLLKNSKLQRLDIEQFREDKGVIKAVLNHYSNIKYLSLYVEINTDFLSFNLKLENLTHLFLIGLKSFSFLSSNLPKIKVVALTCHDGYGITDEDYDFPQLPIENMKNIVKLILNFRKVADVLAVIQKCPKLTDLNLNIKEWYEDKNTSFISDINEILSVAPNVKCLGIIGCSGCSLTKQQLTNEELLSQISKKPIFLKLYGCFCKMLTEEWGRGVEYLRI
jgi:hypothetical protein